MLMLVMVFQRGDLIFIMKYELWQVREKNGSMIYMYAFRHDCCAVDCIDSSKYSLYNKKGEWNIKGFDDFPKFFRWDYRQKQDNKHY